MSLEKHGEFASPILKIITKRGKEEVGRVEYKIKVDLRMDHRKPDRGTGGTRSEVYTAEVIKGKNKGDIVSIKRIIPVEILARKLQVAINKEIEIHMKLLSKHPGSQRIVNFYDHTTCQVGSLIEHFFVLEHCSKGDLSKYFKGKTLSQEEIKRLYRECVEAINVCHNMGIYHRDIKPENFLLDDRESIKLTDFENSVRIDEPPTWGGGTPKYISPELVVRFKSEHFEKLKRSPELEHLKLEYLEDDFYGDKVDIWALGVLLYEIYNGIGSTDVLLKEYIGGKVKPHPITIKKLIIASLDNPSIKDSEYKDLLKKLLNLHPKKRPTTSEILKHGFLAKDIKVRVMPEQSVRSKSHNEEIMPSAPDPTLALLPKSLQESPSQPKGRPSQPKDRPTSTQGRPTSTKGRQTDTQAREMSSSQVASKEMKAALEDIHKIYKGHNPKISDEEVKMKIDENLKRFGGNWQKLLINLQESERRKMKKTQNKPLRKKKSTFCCVKPGSSEGGGGLNKKSKRRKSKKRKSKRRKSRKRKTRKRKSRGSRKR